MSHNGNWKRFNLSKSTAKDKELEAKQKTCQHLNTGKETIPNGEDVIWLTVCKDCLKVLAVE